MLKRLCAALAVASLATPAHAQIGTNEYGEPCAEITDFLTAAERAGEHVVFEGSTKDNYKFFVTSNGMGSWTLFEANNHPDAGGLVPLACIKSSNQDLAGAHQ